MWEARCPACQRVEQHDGSTSITRIVGGARRTAEHPSVAAWKTIAAAQDRGATVVGPCAACGQPLVSDAPDAVAGAYVIDLPGPDVLFDGGFVGPSGTIGRDEALVRIQAALPPPPPPDVGRFFFTSFAAGLGSVGFVLWIAAGAFVVFFLVRGAQTGMLWGHRGTGIYQTVFDK